MKTKTPRKNKTKEEIAVQLKHIEKVNRDKQLVKLMFPLVENMKTVYDAQTVLIAVSGFIKAELANKTNELVVADLNIDLSKEKDSEIKTAISMLLEMLRIEKGQDVADLLKRFGDSLAQFSANEFMKGSMKQITIKNIVAD